MATACQDEDVGRAQIPRPRESSETFTRHNPMNQIASISQFDLFRQAADSYSKDREALKQIKAALMDRKTEIELKLDSPFYEANEEKRVAMEGARGHIIRRMNYVDSLLSTKKPGEIVGWLMWLIDAREHGKDPWMGWKVVSVHPIIWLVEALGEEGDPNDLELSHFHPLTQEQWDKLSHIERV